MSERPSKESLVKASIVQPALIQGRMNKCEKTLKKIFLTQEISHSSVTVITGILFWASGFTSIKMGLIKTYLGGCGMLCGTQ